VKVVEGYSSNDVVACELLGNSTTGSHSDNGCYASEGKQIFVAHLYSHQSALDCSKLLEF